MPRKWYPFLLEVEGSPERWEVEATSVSEAYFLLGASWGQENPDAITGAMAFKITKLWERK